MAQEDLNKLTIEKQRFSPADKAARKWRVRAVMIESGAKMRGELVSFFNRYRH